MSIFGCGYNELWTLGIDTKAKAVTKPAAILPTWRDVVQISAKASHSCAFFADGHAELVGGNDYDAACDGQPAPLRAQIVKAPVKINVPRARAFSMEESAGAVILPDGSVLTWGGSIFAQTGIGTWSEGKERLEPPGVYPTPQKPAFDRPLVALGGGQYHKLGLAADGHVFAWGRNDVGEGADGTQKVKLTPGLTLGLDDPIIAFDGGAKHSLYLRADGKVEASGQGKHAQFGKLGEANRLTRTPIDGLEGVIALAAGGTSSLFLLEDGTVMECGRDKPLAKVPLPGPATWISAGTNHRAAIVEGEALTWDANEWGQLGDGTRETKAAPVATGVACRMLDCGVGHTLFVD